MIFLMIPPFKGTNSSSFMLRMKQAVAQSATYAL